MDKTIEELAKQYAEDMCSAEDYNGGISDKERNFDMSVCIDDAKSVLGWIFDKPIASRMTEAEKAMVRKEYADTKVTEVQNGGQQHRGRCVVSYI